MCLRLDLCGDADGRRMNGLARSTDRRSRPPRLNPAPANQIAAVEIPRGRRGRPQHDGDPRRVAAPFCADQTRSGSLSRSRLDADVPLDVEQLVGIVPHDLPADPVGRLRLAGVAPRTDIASQHGRADRDPRQFGDVGRRRDVLRIGESVRIAPVGYREAPTAAIRRSSPPGIERPDPRCSASREPPPAASRNVPPKPPRHHSPTGATRRTSTLRSSAIPLPAARWMNLRCRPRPEKGRAARSAFPDAPPTIGRSARRS